MEFLEIIFKFGPVILIPMMLIMIGLITKQGFFDSIKHGIFFMVSIAIVYFGVFVITNLLSSFGQNVSLAFGESFQIIDYGWSLGAMAAYSGNITMFVFITCAVVNILMFVFRLTDTINLDIWNYWQFSFGAFLVYTVTNNIVISVGVGAIMSAIILRLADLSSRCAKNADVSEGLSFTQAEVICTLPVSLAVNYIIDKIPLVKNINVNTIFLKTYFGIYGEIFISSALAGGFIGYFGKYDKKEILIIFILCAIFMLAMKFASFLIRVKMNDFFKGLQRQAKRKGRKNINIGIDTSILTGGVGVLLCAIFMIPITVILANKLSFNQMKPYADLGMMLFFVIWPVLVSKGNLFRALVSGVAGITCALYVGTNLAPLLTEVAQGSDMIFMDESILVSSIDSGMNIIPFIFYKIALLL